MRLLQVNGYQTPGRRFNGIGIKNKLAEHGVSSQHIVWEQDSHEAGVSTLSTRFSRWCNRRIRRLEKALGLQSVLFPHAKRLMRLKEFAQADVIHLHIIHSGFFSVLDLPRVTRRKPTVWTLHDPWALTGHCIHPFDCEGWKRGCGSCPALDTPFEMTWDNTRVMFALKRRAYQQMDLDIVVASSWMRRMVEQSPLFDSSTIRLHEIPFGIDLSRFCPGNVAAARARFGIPEDRVVVMFRAEGEFKGVAFILDALKRLQTTARVMLLSVGKTGVLTHLEGKFEIRELGWTNDEHEMVSAMQACDLFLMPSTAETFGVMAIEAMACQKPVICFAGTALPEIVDAPRVGVSVVMRDTSALATAIKWLVENEPERRHRGRLARRLCEVRYADDDYVKNIVTLYRKALIRARSTTK